MATNTEKIIVQVEVKGQKDLQNLEKGSKNTTMAVGNMSKGFGKAALAITAAVASFKAITSVIGGAIKSFRDFEFQMAKVRAVSGASESDFKKLSSTAQELGRTTFFTATQVAELQTNFAKLGFTTEEILDAQSATLDLATATGSDLARAATVAGAAVRGFGLDASETQRVVDVMAVAFTSSAMDIEKFQTSMTKVAPIAKASGFSIEDTTAIMSKLTDAGIEASIAGTSLRNILLKMQDPSSDLTKAFGGTIHGLDQLIPAMRSFVEEGGSMADIMEVVDLRQAAAFEQMITSSEATEILRNDLLNANGAASEMAKTVGDNMEGAFKRLTSALEGLAIAITDSFIGKAITSFIEGLTTAISAVNDLIDSSDSLEETTAETAKALRDEKEEIENLSNEYNDLLEKTDKTNRDKIRMNAILDNLRTRLGNSVVAINNETGALELNQEALDKVISRHALLADKEAVKLVRKIRKAQEAIDKETESLNIQNDSIQKQELLLSELSKSMDDVAKDNIIVGEGFMNASDALGDYDNAQRDYMDANQRYQKLGAEGTAQNAKIIEQQNKINGLVSKRTKQEKKLNDAIAKHTDLTKKLRDAGWSQSEIEALLIEEIDEKTKKIFNSTVVTDNETDAINDNTNAKIENKHATRLAVEEERDYLDIMQMVLDGTLTQEEANEALRLERIKAIQDSMTAIENEGFLITGNYELYMKLERELIDLKLKGLKDEESARQKNINAVGSMGEQLINLAGQDEKYQKIREAGVKLSAAAALANNLETISLQGKALSKDLALGFPMNIPAIASTLALIISIRQNMAALTSGKMAKGGMIEEFANGGMVHGKSHANGGEKFAVGGRVVELEGGEAVINKRSTAMFRNQLSAMNAAGGGVKFADGGLLNNPSFTQQQFSALGQSNLMGAMNGASKVVVVESDITDAQRSVSVIEADATI